MSPHIVVEALGVTVQIDFSALPVDWHAAVREAWRDTTITRDEPVDVVAEVLVPADGIDEVLSRLSTQVTLAALERRKGDCWMLHAAGLAASDGRVVALVGLSGLGKTTASCVLGQRYGYVSDEIVGVDAQGRVLPYRKPLSIIERAERPKVQRAPSDLGLQPIPDAPLRLVAVAVLDRRPDGPRTPSVEPLGLGEAFEHIVPQCSYLTEMRAPLRAIAAQLAATGGAVRIVYREAESLGDVLEELFRRERGFAAVGPRADERSPAGKAHARPEGFFRSPVVDALDLDDGNDGVAILQRRDGQGHLRVLGGIAPALWRAADGVGIDELCDAAIDGYGRPEGIDIAAVVDDAVRALVAEGVLTQEAWWRIRDDVAWTGGPDRVVALPLRGLSAQPRALEDSGRVIWRLLAEAGPLTFPDLVRKTADAFDMTAEEIEADVAMFVEQLRQSELLGR